MKKLTRFAVVASAALFAQMSFAETTVRIQDYSGTGNLLARVADSKGFCKEAGLKCELKTIPAAPLGLQTMLAGDIDVAYGPTEVAAAALARKAPIKIIGAGFVDPVFFMIAGAKTQLANETKGYPAVVQSMKGMTACGSDQPRASGEHDHAGTKPTDYGSCASSLRRCDG